MLNQLWFSTINKIRSWHYFNMPVFLLLISCLVFLYQFHLRLTVNFLIHSLSGVVSIANNNNNNSNISLDASFQLLTTYNVCCFQIPILHMRKLKLSNLPLAYKWPGLEFKLSWFNLRPSFLIMLLSLSLSLNYLCYNDLTK